MFVQYTDNFTATGLSFKNSLDIDHWQQVGQRIRLSDKSHQWWIGDWIVYGQKNFKTHSWFANGKTQYEEIKKATGFEVQTLKNCAHVARTVLSGVRRESLSWKHHDAVSKFQPDDQKGFLDLAEREKLSVADLRKRLPSKSKSILPAKETVVVPKEECDRLMGLFRDRGMDIKHNGTVFTLSFSVYTAKEIQDFAPFFNKHFKKAKVDPAADMTEEEHHQNIQAIDHFVASRAAD